MKLHQSLTVTLSVLFSTGALSSVVFAQEGTPPAKSSQLVEVQLREDNLAPYKDRRTDHGMYIAVDYEDLVLKNFTSAIDGSSYEGLFGTSPIPLIHMSIDYKYNMDMGSLAIGVDLGKGSVSDNKNGQDRTLEVTKYGFGAKFVADMIMKEPYVAPYIGINIWQLGLNDKSKTASFSETTKIGFNYTLGLLLQLDWLDSQTAKNTTFNWGLENTFIDIYATQYAKSTGSADPDTQTDFIYGAGLRLEF
ncbi:MAG: hypothetical protein ACXVCY_01400 [Pseudobdellovibrionaceae bacterium]